MRSMVLTRMSPLPLLRVESRWLASRRALVLLDELRRPKLPGDPLVLVLVRRPVVLLLVLAVRAGAERLAAAVAARRAPCGRCRALCVPMCVKGKHWTL
eukprot:scaffold2213_cov143-Isochrysis_galbana.AAC.1